MKNYCIRFLIALFVVAALTTAARGQAADQLIVKIPYDFVAAGATLPAGNYRVSRVSDFNEDELVISSFENSVAVIAVSSVVEPARAGKPGVTFQQIGDQRFLTRIQTADHVFTFAAPSSTASTMLAKRQSAPSGSASGTASGSN